MTDLAALEKETLAAIQAASVVSVASYISVSTNLSVFAAEVAATLTALGLWKGAA